MVAANGTLRHFRGFWTSLALDGKPALRIWMHTGALVAVLAVPTLLAYALDDRRINDISVWIKPLKFQASIVLHLFTLAVVASLLLPRARDGRILLVTAWVSSAMALFEIAYIMVQAARGRRSHFNEETTIEAVLYVAMGLGAVTLVLASAVVGVLVVRAPRADIGPGVRWGAGLGLVAGSAATLAVAGYLGSAGSHWVGGVPSDAGGLPLTGWSTTGGDLRVPHFFATHMMQGLPLIGLIADRVAGNPPAMTVVATGLWLALVAGTFIQALLGQPLLPL